MTVELVYLGKSYVIYAEMTASLLVTVGYLGLESRIDKRDDVGAGENLAESVYKVAECGQNAEKLLARPVRILELTNGIVCPAVVGAAENEHGVNVLTLEKALARELVEAVNKGACV